MKCSMFLLIGSFCAFVSIAQEEWTWLYEKRFNQNQLASHRACPQLSFFKEDTPVFTQLIFSWNAFRPKEGFYRFKVRVRDACTKAWYPWHTMCEWGSFAQYSFCDKALGATEFHHVRLQVPNKRLADAFLVKVEGCGQAECSLLHGLYINISDFTRFTKEQCGLLHEFPSVHIREVPVLSQMTLNHPKKKGLCSPTSCTMLTQYLLNRKLDPVAFAEQVYDKGLDIFGNWSFNLAHAYELCSGAYSFRVQRLSSFGQLHALLEKKMPVVVSVRGVLEGGAKEYGQGHLLVVVGWDAHSKKIICHDPAFEDSEKICVKYSIDDFLRAWERSHRLAYVTEKVLSVAYSP